MVSNYVVVVCYVSVFRMNSWAWVVEEVLTYVKWIKIQDFLEIQQIHEIFMSIGRLLIKNPLTARTLKFW